MEKEEVDKFSWSGLFVVTACCTFLFNVGLKIVDGEFSRILLAVSVLSVALAVLNGFAMAIERRYLKKKKRKRYLAE